MERNISLQSKIDENKYSKFDIIQNLEKFFRIEKEISKILKIFLVIFKNFEKRYIDQIFLSNIKVSKAG